MDKIVANALATQFEAFDPETLQNAKDRIIDTVGCLIGGAGDPSNPELVRLITDHGGEPQATILMYGGKVPAAQAAMVNCILCRSFDYEPVSPVVEDSMAPGHVSGTTVMTALTLGEAVGAGGREIITAMLLGDDLAARLLNTCEFTLALGWDGNGTANAMGATAIAGRLLGLNEKQLRNAFGLVLSQLSGSAQNISESTTAFKLPLGLAARNAIFSAELAAAGWTAPKDALLGQVRLLRPVHERHPQRRAADQGSGQEVLGRQNLQALPVLPWYPRAHRLRPGHRATSTASIPTASSRVTLYSPGGGLDGVLGQPWEIGDFPHGNAIFSFRFTIATALLNGSVKPEHFTEQAIRDPQINEFIKKIDFADLPGGRKGVALTVRTKDGSEYAAESQIARGDIAGNPLSRDELLAKFWGQRRIRAQARDRATQRRCSRYWRTWKDKTASAR